MPNGGDMGFETTSASIASAVTEKVMEASITRFGGMVGGALTSCYGWATSAKGMAAIGLLITFGGFAVNLVYQKKRNTREALAAERDEQRKDELQRAKLEAIRAGKYEL